MELIAGELDIFVPDISFSKVESFLKNTKQYHDSSVFSTEEKIYFERNSRTYPWERRVLEYEGKEFYDYLNVEPFKDLKSVIDRLPIKKESRVVLLISQKEQDSYDFNFHFDRDSVYGFRICLGLDTTKPFLEIGELKPEFENYSENSKKIEDYMVTNNIYMFTPMRSNTVLCLRGAKYPHRVPINSGSRRCVLIVRGSTPALDDLNFLQRINR